MSDLTVYVAEAGRECELPAFKAVFTYERGAEKQVSEWREDCTNTKEWWFSVSEVEVDA